MRTFLTIALIFFSFFTYESFWTYFFGVYSPIAEYILALSVVLVFLVYNRSVKFRMGRDNYLILWFLFFFLVYCVSLSIFRSVSRVDLFVFVVITQFTLIVMVLAIMQRGVLGARRQLSLPGFNGSGFLFSVMAVSICLLAYYLNLLGGAAHSIFNQNWVIIGSFSFLLLCMVDYIGKGNRVPRMGLFLPVLSITVSAFLLGSLGGTLAGLVLLIIVMFRVMSGAIMIISVLIPLVSLVLLSTVFQFSFSSINGWITKLIDAPVEIDYSSGRFASWDFVLEKFSQEPLFMIFGGGVDSASNLYFSNEGVTASGHNFWIETLFRVGVLGVLINVLPYIVMYFLMSNYRVRPDYKKAFVTVFVFMITLGLFYDIGGFTHLSGTFFYKGMLVLIFAISVSEVKKKFGSSPAK